GGRKYLDGHTAAHQFVFTQVDATHAALAQTFEHLVLADMEALPLAKQELLGLKHSKKAIADHGARQLTGLRRKGSSSAHLLQLGFELLLGEAAALADQIHEIRYRRWRRHRPPLRSRERRLLPSPRA